VISVRQRQLSLPLGFTAQPHRKTKLVLSAIHKLEEAYANGVEDPRGLLTHDEQRVMDEGFSEGRRQIDIPPNRSGYSLERILLHWVWIYLFYSADGYLYLRSEYTGNCLLRGPDLS
jgi:hypothetical protein